MERLANGELEFKRPNGWLIPEAPRCPQCRQLLPRWDLWGWKIDWTCSSCGCQVGR